MRRLWILFGRIAFWMALPLLHVYLRLSKRTRVLVINGDRVLVVRGWLNDGSWSLPGGGLHRKENPVSGACREVLEETGIRLPTEKLVRLGTARQNQHGLSFEYVQFATNLKEPPAVNPQRWEIVEARWVPFKDLSIDNAQAHVLDTIAAWRAHR